MKFPMSSMLSTMRQNHALLAPRCVVIVSVFVAHVSSLFVSFRLVSSHLFALLSCLRAFGSPQTQTNLKITCVKLCPCVCVCAYGFGTQDKELSTQIKLLANFFLELFSLPILIVHCHALNLSQFI